MPFPWLAAAAGLGSVLGIGSGKRQQKRNQEQWELQNAYNHPSEQMNRLKEAGLNPNLIYGGSPSGASGSAQSAPEASKVNVMNTRAPAEIAMAAGTRTLSNDNLRAQNKVLQQDALLKNAQALKAMMDTDIKGVNLKVAQRTMEDIISKIQSESSTAFNNAELTWQKLEQNRFTPEQNNIIKQKNLQGILTKALTNAQNLTNAQKLEELRSLEVKLKQKGLKYFDSNAIVRIISQIFGLSK